MSQSPHPFEVAALYHFGRLPHFRDLRAPLQALCESHDVKGILLVAEEGINGTLAGPPGSMQSVIEGIKSITGFAGLDHKMSYADAPPFLRLKVRLKVEIVTIGDTSIDPNALVGTYVEPQDWNALLNDPEVLLVDTRNSVEVRIGTFEGAMDPQTESFSQFPDFVKANLDPTKHKKIAMFCTGGIRCEKATSFMLQNGFENVYHLKGGILKYLETVAPDESKWQGDCFVFDRRVALGHGLRVAEELTLCAGCRVPLTQEDRESPDYEAGVCCPHCTHVLTLDKKAAARERQKQIQLSRARGKTHMGPRSEVG